MLTKQKKETIKRQKVIHVHLDKGYLFLIWNFLHENNFYI